MWNWTVRKRWTPRAKSASVKRTQDPPGPSGGLDAESTDVVNVPEARARDLMLLGGWPNNLPSPLIKPRLINNEIGQQTKSYYQFRRRLDFPHHKRRLLVQPTPYSNSPLHSWCIWGKGSRWRNGKGSRNDVEGWLSSFAAADFPRRALRVFHRGGVSSLTGFSLPCTVANAFLGMPYHSHCPLPVRSAAPKLNSCCVLI